MMYLALWDNQCKRYMHTGRNTTKPKELKEALLSYYNGDIGDGSIGDIENAENMDVFELADLGEFTVVSSNTPFDDGEGETLFADLW
jgi:hypothetical protein